jgi:hypothetical protein
VEEIFDWTDNYTENLLPTPDSQEAQHALACIGSLWIQYATMEQNLRQWKKAVQVYDDALNDPVASRAVAVYLAYADLCKLRGKISNAQKVYIKGLTANFPLCQTDQIWRDFLSTMRESGSPDLTADQLYAAVSSQGAYQFLNKPSSNIGVEAAVKPNEPIRDEPAPKRIKTENVQPSTGPRDQFVSPTKRLTEIMVSDSLRDTEPVKTNPTSVNVPTSAAPVLTNLHGLSIQTVDDLLNSYSSRPTMLFRPLNPENLKVFFIGEPISSLK